MRQAVTCILLGALLSAGCASRFDRMADAARKKMEYLDELAAKRALASTSPTYTTPPAPVRRVEPCDPGGIPPIWKNVNWSSEFDAALATLQRYGINPPTSIIRFTNGCSSSSDEGCYVHTQVKESHDSTWTVERRVVRQTGWVPKVCWNPYAGRWYQTGWQPVMGEDTVEEPRKRRVTRIVDEKDRIYLQDCFIHRGWLNMDEEGEILWDTNNKQSAKEDQYNLFYQYAKSPQEAIEFLLAHEMAHYAGVTSQGDADRYAQKVIVEIRKMKRSWPYRVWRYRSSYSGANQNMACQTAWIPPPLDDLPTGGEDMPPPGAR